MSASSAQDLLLLLENAGFSSTAIGWGMQPDDPDRYITLKDTAGPSLLTHDGGQTLQPGVQVLVRAATGARDGRNRREVSFTLQIHRRL
jgi:hypothetical protein